MVLALSLAAVAPASRRSSRPRRSKPAASPPGLEIRAAGDHAVRITLQPDDARTRFPFPYTPALADRDYPGSGDRAEQTSTNPCRPKSPG